MAVKKHKVELATMLRAIDQKNRNFWKDLSEDERKEVSTFLAMRYSASVEGSRDLQYYYLQATNEQVNKNFFNIPAKFAELQWLSCTTVSPSLGTCRHYWQSDGKSAAGNKHENQIKQIITKLYPSWKSSDVDMFIKINTHEDIIEWLKLHGQELPKK